MRWLIPEVLQEAKEQDRLDLACAWLLRCWRPQGEGLPLGQRVDGEVQAPSLLPPPGVLTPRSPPAGPQGAAAEQRHRQPGSGPHSTEQAAFGAWRTWLDSPQSPPEVNSTEKC